MTLRSGEGPRLRLTEHAGATPGRYTVEVALEGDGPRKAEPEKKIAAEIQKTRALLADIDRRLTRTHPA